MVMRSDCARLADAIASGRFLEDPAHWQGHVASCADCRAHVEGLFELREHMARAGLEVEAPPPVEVGPGRVQHALLRFHRRRIARRTTLGCVLVAAAAGGVAVWGRRSPSAPEDPTAHARRLFTAVFPAAGKARPLLTEDAHAREEYVRALDDPSSLVRRTALQALALSGVETDASRLARALTDFREELETPVAVAGVSGGEREIASALALRRTETVKAVLLAAYVQAARGGERLPSSVVLPFLSDPDRDVRREALQVLGADSSFVPGEEVRMAVRSDPDVEVRINAVQCLVDRLGDDGAAFVVDHLRSVHDTPLEAAVVSLLGRYRVTLPFSRERAESRETPVELALQHQLVLLRAGDKKPPSELVERALLVRTPGVLRVLASLAHEGDWTEYRGRLQAAWKSGPPADVAAAGLRIVLWDLDSRDPRRLALALDICEATGGAQAQKLVQRVASEAAGEVRERAEGLLRSWPAK